MPCRSAFNSTGDTGDATPDGTCDTCTLREAIQEANATTAADIINFNIGGSGVKTISPAMPLPNITGPVTIDGYTEPGAKQNTLARGNDAVLVIELNGTNAGMSPNGNGLTITASNVVVKGLVINRFPWQGISIPSGTSNRIESNFIGADPSGTQDLGNNTSGVAIFSAAPNNTVGGTAPAARNVISSNGLTGVSLNATGTKVEGNYIGTKKGGTGNLGNGNNGVSILIGSSTIGGSDAGAANVIAFNGQDEVYVVNSTTTGNRILNNSMFSN